MTLNEKDATVAQEGKPARKDGAQSRNAIDFAIRFGFIGLLVGGFIASLGRKSARA